MTYDYAEFLRRVSERTWRERRQYSLCYVCDVVLPETVDSGHRRGQERALCKSVSGGTIDAHHVLSKRLLKDEMPLGWFAGGPVQWVAPDFDEQIKLKPVEDYRSLDDLLMEPRNGLLLRRYHHDQVTNARLHIPTGLLPADALEFADEIGLRWWLEKMEGRRASEGV